MKLHIGRRADVLLRSAVLALVALAFSLTPPLPGGSRAPVGQASVACCSPTEVLSPSLPTPIGGTFWQYDTVRVNSEGDIAFEATIEGLTGVSGGIFVQNGVNGTLRKVVAVGDPAPLGGTFTTFGCSYDFNDNGDVAFEGYSAAGDAIYLSTATGLQEVVRAGDTSPLGGTYGSFTCTDWGFSIGRLNAGISLNNSDQISFGTALYAPGGGFLANAPGAFFRWSAGHIDAVAYVGEQPLPLFSALSYLMANQIDASGQVYFEDFPSEIWFWNGSSLAYVFDAAFPTFLGQVSLICGFDLAKAGAPEPIALGVQYDGGQKYAVLIDGRNGITDVADSDHPLPNGESLNSCPSPVIEAAEAVAFWGPATTGVGASLFLWNPISSQLVTLDSDVWGAGQLAIDTPADVVYSRSGGIWEISPHTLQPVIVLVHGYNYFNRDNSQFCGMESLQSWLSDPANTGNVQFKVECFEYASSPGDIDAASKLYSELKRLFAKDHAYSFDIIAHSNGGLVSRYCVEKVPGCAGFVHSLTLVGTPSLGTKVAYFPCWVLRQHDQGACDLPPNSSFLRELNKSPIDQHGVPYNRLAGIVGNNILETPNDCVVTVDSVWGPFPKIPELFVASHVGAGIASLIGCKDPGELDSDPVRQRIASFFWRRTATRPRATR